MPGLTDYERHSMEEIVILSQELERLREYIKQLEEQLRGATVHED